MFQGKFYFVFYRMVANIYISNINKYLFAGFPTHPWKLLLILVSKMKLLLPQQ